MQQGAADRRLLAKAHQAAAVVGILWGAPTVAD